MAQQSLLFGFTSKGLAALSLIAAVSYFLFVEHREDLFQFLPYLILLLYPLMHIFMHAGHGHDHGGHDGQANTVVIPSEMPINEAWKMGARKDNTAITIKRFITGEKKFSFC